MQLLEDLVIIRGQFEQLSGQFETFADMTASIFCYKKPPIFVWDFHQAHL